MRIAQSLAISGQGLLEEHSGLIKLAQILQKHPQVAHRAAIIRVVLPEQAATAVEQLAPERFGLRGTSLHRERNAKIVQRPQGVLVIAPEHPALRRERVTPDAMGRFDVALAPIGPAKTGPDAQGEGMIVAQHIRAPSVRLNERDDRLIDAPERVEQRAEGEKRLQRVRMVLAEGLATQLERLEAVERSVLEVERLAPSSIDEYRARLAERIAELSKGLTIDPQRLAQEVAFFAERCDVAEELTRLKSHFVQFRALCAAPEPAGRKLDFLVQEMHREVNTTGSKSANAAIAAHVVQLKAELERVREQVQNVE